MNKLFAALCLTVWSIVCVSAQTPGEYNKNEFFVGYSNQQVDFGDRVNFNGFEASYTRNVSRYFGIKGDVSGAYRNRDFNISELPGTTGAFTFRAESKSSIYNFLGGVQVKDNASTARLKPFAHALVGVAVNRQKNRLSCTSGNCPSFIVNSSTNAFTESGLAGAFGGGLDIKINNRIDLRAIQADYNPTRIDGRTANSFRFGIGLVFK